LPTARAILLVFFAMEVAVADQAEAPGAEEEESHVCRICLASESCVEGRLIAPCRCSGTMKYVHRSCLRTWRTQGSARAAERCSVCGEAYKSEWGATSIRLALKYPATSASAIGSLLFWALAPRIHGHLAGAAWMHVVAPLPGLNLWSPWEANSGVWSALCSWALGGAVCLTGPALVDHLLAALRPGPVATRLCELVLLAENARRLTFLFRLATVRLSLRSADGLHAMLRVQDAVRDTIEADGCKDVTSYRRVVEDLLARCFGVGSSIARSRSSAADSTPWLQCLELSCTWPHHLYVYLKVFGAQLGCRSKLQRWLPLLWHLANRDVGHVAVFTDLLLGGPFWSISAALVRHAWPDFDANNGQMQHAFCNLRDFICSVIRGARAVRVMSLYVT